MEEFLLKREPLDIVRISTALFVQVEEGEWSGILEKKVENFENVLKRVLERVPQEDVERRKKLQSFSTGKKLAKRVSYGIITSEEADVRCNTITSRMHRSNRCHCCKICLEFFWQIENYSGKLG
ncbi:hypothetical protein C1646_661711 [Rhizophagus diaphanus]|nr:hypothetical protein C1646_661711 [Rhizophagus diaphanus] [Rhizophagus sp. MUCL 43196]